ncbi:MAG: hypothetical protein QOG35_472 [Solirubrobacteraceae bacterium]|nr:hypothetical protein [Solirubrobacteraceae bacterium]
MFESPEEPPQSDREFIREEFRRVRERESAEERPAGDEDEARRQAEGDGDERERGEGD